MNKKVSAVVTYEARGKEIPLLRSHDPAVVREMARAIVRQLSRGFARDREVDETLAALGQQEIARIRQALAALGIPVDLDESGLEVRG